MIQSPKIIINTVDGENEPISVKQIAKIAKYKKGRVYLEIPEEISNKISIGKNSEPSVSYYSVREDRVILIYDIKLEV